MNCSNTVYIPWKLKAEQFNTASGFFSAIHAGRKDLCVIYNNEITRVEEGKNIFKAEVSLKAGSCVEVEESGRVPLGSRFLSDTMFRQFEVVVFQLVA